jgi:hypothetical protein
VSLPSPTFRFSPVQDAEPDTGDDRWVVFEFCISLMVVTLRRPSRPIRIRSDQRAWVRGLPYTGVSLLCGWWGLPWGVVYTPLTIFTNLRGGCDITAQIREAACPKE